MWWLGVQKKSTTVWVAYTTEIDQVFLGEGRVSMARDHRQGAGHFLGEQMCPWPLRLIDQRSEVSGSRCNMEPFVGRREMR